MRNPEPTRLPPLWLSLFPPRLIGRLLQFLAAYPLIAMSVLLASSAEAASPPTLKEVVVVFKTHFDLGYTDFASNVVNRYRTTMMDEALKVVEQSRQLPEDQRFVWTIPGWPATQMTADWSGQTEHRKTAIQQAFKEGRFVVHGLPFTTHTESLEPEDLVRGLAFSTRFCSLNGLPLPRDAKMTDVPCHTSILPTLLCHAGIEFLHLGCNAASSSPQVSPLFWWEGPDGSRLLTMYSAAGYGTGLVPPASWPYRTWLALIHTGDNHGPPRPEEIKDLLAEAASKLPGVRVQVGRLSDFSDRLLAERPDLPVIRGDMPDTWIHGPLSDPVGARWARQLRPLLATAETLDFQLRNTKGLPISPSPEVSSFFDKAYERSLLYGEHTWGGALSWVTPYSGNVNFDYGAKWKADRAAGRFGRIEASWSEHSAYIYALRDLLTPWFQDRMRSLAESVNVPGRRVVVYNPLPWKRSGPVRFIDTSHDFHRLLADDGSTVSLQSAVITSNEGMPVTWQGDEGCFFARDIPPMGYRSFVPVAAERLRVSSTSEPRGVVLENRFLRVTLDPDRYCVKSIRGKASGREWVDASAEEGFGQYLYQRFDESDVARYVAAYVKSTADWATNELGKPNAGLLRHPTVRQASPHAATTTPPNTPTKQASDGFTFQTDSVAQTAVMTCPAGDGLPHPVTLRVVLYHDAPWVELEVTVVNKPADPWPEAGWLCLPFAIRNPSFRVGRPGSIVDPARDLVAGANHDLMAVQTGVALFDADRRGVGLCALDSPLVSLDRPGCWRYEREFTPRRPRVYVQLFNNQWSTNFRLWNEGTWSSRIRLWDIAAYEAAGGLTGPALEARYPLQAAAVAGTAGSRPPTQAGVSIDRPGILVSSLADNPAGPGAVLRLWEMAGSAEPCRMTLPKEWRVKSLQPLDLRGRPIGAALTVDSRTDRADTCSIPLRAWAPASFLLR